jgi:uncharacterized protein YqgV (UPF0045/DUF77 family)
MKITAELSLYPLEGDVVSDIVGFIRELTTERGLEIVVNQMSTQVRGELGEVMDVVRRALARSFASGAPAVLVAKFLNVDLPIKEPPVLD